MDPEEDAGDDVSFYEDDDEGTSDITDLGEPDERWELSLKQCLDDLKPGQITFFKEYHEFANPGIKVEHHPEIPLPLTERGAEAIKSVCRQPRFGHDDKTVVDTTVRNTWELGYTQYKLQNPHWMKFLSKIVGDAGHELGIERVVAVPHRMLLYEPGSHKGTEQEAGTLGTLVICLPSKHEGSNVNLSHRAEKHTLRTAPTSAYDVTALAWYSEVAHEVEELTSGYRLVLTHKLLQVSGNRLTAETFFSQKEQLRSILSPQQLLNMSSQILAYGLDHQYTQSSFSLKNLKGRDQTLCHALRNLCSESGLYVFLAHVVRSKYEIDDDEIYSGYYEDEDQANQDATTKLENVYSLDGELIATSVEIALGDVLGISYTDREPDSTEKCDYMGNETSTHRYHDAAIIILRTGSMGGFLRPSHHFTSMRTADPKAVAMVKIAAHDLEKHPENPLLELELVTLIKAARECGIVYHIESARILITWGLILGKTSLIVPVLNARLRPEWVDEVNQVIAEVLQKRFDKEKDGVEWNKLLGFLTNYPARHFEQIKLRFVTEWLSRDARESLGNWFAAIVDKKFEDLVDLGYKDYQLVSRKFRENANDKKRMMESFLPSIVRKSTRELTLAILHDISVSRNSSYAGMAQEMYKIILRIAGTRLLLKPEEVVPEPTRAPNATSKNVRSRHFIRMMEEGYINDAREETSKLVEKTCDLLASDTLETVRMLTLQQASLINDLLRPLAIGLSTHHVEPLPSVQKFFKKCVRHIHEAVPKKPSTGLRGWAHHRRGCSPWGENVCKDCTEMDKFLASTTDQVWKLCAAEHRRNHISDRLGSRMYALAIIKGGSPHTLVVRKKEPEEDRVQREYSRKMDHMNSILEPLRMDYVKELLGEATYEELVMLGSTNKLKREAESSPESAAKRQRR